MNKYIIFIIIIVFCSMFTFSQESSEVKKEQPKLLDKVYFGGNFGLQFGTQTFINVSPIIGIKLTERLSSGVGLIYNYYSDRYYNFKTSIYGGKAFANYFFIENAFAHVEYEIQSLETEYFDYSHTYQNVNRFWIASFLVGGGYRYKIGNRSAINMMVLFNLNESINSPYNNPIFRMGFIF